MTEAVENKTQPQQTSGFGGIHLNYVESHQDSDLPALTQVSLVDDAPKEQGLVSLAVNPGKGPAAPPLTQDELRRKVGRFSFALGKNMPQEDIQRFLTSGNEAQLREHAAGLQGLQDERDRTTTLKDILSEGLPPEPERQSVLYGNVKALNGFKPANDPNTIIEQAYAKNFVKTVPTVGPQDSAINRTIDEVSRKALTADEQRRINETKDRFLTIEEAAVQNKLYQENAKDVLEKAEQRYAKESFFGKVVDFGKSAVPFYDYYNMSMDVPGMEAHGVLTGTTVADWVTKLYDQPPAVQKQWLEQAVDTIGAYNPQLAVRVAEAAVNYSTTEKFFDNMFGVLDVADAPQLGVATVGMAIGSVAAARMAMRRRSALKAFQAGVAGGEAAGEAKALSPVVAHFDFDKYVSNIGDKTAEAMSRAANAGRLPDRPIGNVMKEMTGAVTAAMRAAKEASQDDPERLNVILTEMGRKVSQAMQKAEEHVFPSTPTARLADIGERTRQTMPPLTDLKRSSDEPSFREFFQGKVDLEPSAKWVKKIDDFIDRRSQGDGSRRQRGKDIPLWTPPSVARSNPEGEARLMAKIQKRSGASTDRPPMTSEELAKAAEQTRQDLIKANAKLGQMTKREKAEGVDLSLEKQAVRKWIEKAKKGLNLQARQTQAARMGEASRNALPPGSRSAAVMAEAQEAFEQANRARAAAEIRETILETVRREAERIEQEAVAKARRTRTVGQLRQTMQTAPGPSQYDSVIAEVAETYKDAIRASADPQANPADFQAALGDINGAATHTVASSMGSQGQTLAQQPLSTVAPAFVNPTAAQGASNGLAAAQTGRFANWVQQRAGQLRAQVEAAARVNRLPEEALQMAFQIERQEFEDAISQSLNNALQNAQTFIGGQQRPVGPVQPLKMTVQGEPVRPEATVENLGRWEFEIAKPDGSLFSGQHWQQEMHTWARWMGLEIGDYGAARKGNGWVMTISKPLDETRPLIRDQLLQTKNKTPLSTMFSSFKHGGGRVSEFASNNRIAYVVGQEKVREAIQPFARDFLELKADQVDALNRVMMEEMNAINPANGLPGRFFQNAQEFDAAYRRLIGRSPTSKEKNAYISARILNDLEFGMRNASYYKELARLGVKEIRLRARIANPKTGFVTTGEESFEGKVLDKLPLDATDAKARAMVTLYDEGVPDPKIVPLNSLITEKGKGFIQELQDKGYKIIQTANPSRKPGSAVFGEEESVNFILTKDFSVHELSNDLIKYREGWHQTYNYKFFVKQPTVRKIDKVDAATGKTFTHHLYEGETVLMGFHTEAEARKYSSAMETARQMAFEGRAGNLDKFLAENLPYRRRQFMKLFSPGPNGEPPHFSKTEPFHSLGDGKTSMDSVRPAMIARYPELYDTIRSPWNIMNQVDKKFVGHRDEIIHTVKEGKGTQGNPVFNLVRGDRLDPLSAMSDGLANMIRNHHMIDLRLQVGESWIKEFRHILNPDSEQVLYNDMVGTIMNPPYLENIKDGKTPALFADYKRAEQARQAFLELMNLETPAQAEIESLRSAALDEVYARLGQETSNRLATKDIMQTRHPLAFFRGAAFHAKVGFFNPMVAIQNVMSMANIWAISPKHATGIIPFAVYAHLTRLNSFPAVTKAMGALAEKASGGAYKKEWFTEGLDLMKKSGFWSVGGGHSLNDYLNDPKFVYGKLGRALDATSILFTESEKMLRTSAFMTAYIEHKVANPAKDVTSIDLNEILGRANLYAGRMSRDEKARWQSGEVMSTMYQFMSYQVRLGEMLLEAGHGRKDALTGAEKARLLAVNSILYGIPIGVGGTVAGAAFNPYDHLKKQMADRGVHWDEGQFGALFNGVVGEMSKHYLGVNLSPALGPQGRDFMARLDEDYGWIKLVTGPAGALLISSAQSSYPLYLSSWMFVNGELDPRSIPGDLLDIFRNVSTIDKATKAYLAYRYGSAFTKGGREIGEVDVWAGVASAISGQPTAEHEKMFTEQDILRDVPEKLAKLGAAAAHEFRLSQRAHNAGDYKLEAFYAKRGTLLMGALPLEERQKVIHTAIQGDQELILDSRRKWERHHPESTEEFRKAFKELYTNVPDSHD